MSDTDSAEDARLARVRLVAIGASAGGVEALGQLLRALPADCPVALAVVLHIHPDGRSRLPALFGGRCLLPVKEVEDKETVRAGTVYFAAADYHMQLEMDGTFSLSQDEPVHYSRPAIDVMLETAALAYRDEMLAIVLTGANADGAAGLAQVRKLGGLAWVQDPAQAAVPAMPAAALKLAGADQVLSLEQIAQGLAGLGGRRPGPPP
ncbi:two-component system chemotaxis response regulator CheB [Oxalobacteraceae bacterium GrIS 1.11]